jgi:7-keto-8-aminopelargonate synthetase-like enzyme
MARGLSERGLLAEGAGRTPIFPVIVGDDRRAVAATQFLLDRGIYAQAIRPPTVPRGTARLRFALMASHTVEHIDAALAALDAARAAGLL